MRRGNRRQNIYFNDVDRQDFLKTLAEACQKTGFSPASSSRTYLIRRVSVFSRISPGAFPG